MPRAIVLNSASIVAATGGTWGDTFAILSGDSFSVANYGGPDSASGARILEAWGTDSDSVAEIRWYYTRQDSTHDQNYGIRYGLPALSNGGAAKNPAFQLLDGLITVPLYKSDIATIQATSSNLDDLVISWVTEYDDLPGASSQFADWTQVQNMRKSTLGIQVTAVAGSVGLYGTARAFNADDVRLHANTYYAVLGATVQTAVSTIALAGPGWGNFKIGMPGAVTTRSTPMWFVEQTLKWGKPLIPILNSNDVGNINVYVMDAEASTSPHIDFILYELTGNPVTG